MNDLVAYEKIEPPEIPEDWDFEEADKDFDAKRDKLIATWRRLGEEAGRLMWPFYVKLKKQGARRDLSEISEKLPSWLEWVKAKNIDHDTALELFRRLGFIPPIALVSRMTGAQENYTPEKIINCVRDVLGTIDLDPASSTMAQKLIKAKKFFTEDDDGLKKPWKGNVFLNPPYKMPLIKNFTDKLIDELPNIESAIMLTNDQTDTLWFQKCAAAATVVCFTKGRINFYTPEKEKTFPTNGQAFQYFGKDKKRFIEIFKSIGLLMEPIR